MAKRSSTSTSVRLEVSLDSIVKTESKAIKALNNVVDTDFKTKIAATDISDEQKKDNFFKQALKYEIMLEKLSDDKLTKDLTTDDFESLYKQIEDQVNIRTNDSR
jgi:hypothetical protein